MFFHMGSNRQAVLHGFSNIVTFHKTTTINCSGTHMRQIKKKTPNINKVLKKINQPRHHSEILVRNKSLLKNLNLSWNVSLYNKKIMPRKRN